MKHVNDKKSKSYSWCTTALTTAVLIGLSAISVSVNSATNDKLIGDLEIYKAATPGIATIFMMLDTSGSMDKRSIRDDYGNSYATNCTESEKPLETIFAVVYERKLQRTVSGVLIRDDNGQPVSVKDFNNIKETITFTPKGCTTGSNSNTRYSRLVRLQIALIELLADEVYDLDSLLNLRLKETGSLADDYEIGLGNYSYTGNGRSGVVLVPTAALTPAQRVSLIEKTKGLQATGGTPTAHALAESGAYMMGTTTISDVKVLAERENRNNRTEWRRCNTNGNSNTLTFDPELGIYVYDCNSWGNWSTSSGSATSGILSGYNVASNIDHADNGRTYFAGDNSDSGFINSSEMTKETGGNNYSSPLSTNECSGNGIYLLTDGEPQLANSSGQLESSTNANNRAKKVMNTSLLGATSPLSVSSCNGLSGGSDSGAWGCMAEYATLLRNTDNNPLRLPIKTATVGFGKAFDGLTGTREIIVDDEPVSIIDCDSGRTSGSNQVSQNTRNLCKLGERKGDSVDAPETLGNGGFYYTEESTEIAASIADFAASLVQIVNTAPSGTITIPEDPYRAANQLPYAYLPMLDPDIVSTSSIWKGNLKKYALDQGTLFGKSDKLLYKDVSGDLDETTQDLWQMGDFIKGGATANNDIEAGGVYAKLRAPNSGLTSLRTLYVEDYKSEDDETPVLRKLSVDPSSGKPVGFDALVDTTVYTETNKRRLLSFLGFDGLFTNDGQMIDEDITVDNLTLSAPTEKIKVLGGVIHSKPTAVSYSATLDENGRITDDRDDYVLFGSMDGALHLVDSDTGEETFAIIPKYMLEEQPEALVEGSSRDVAGEPYFGVDAPWLVTTDYKYDLSTDPDTDGKVAVDDTGNKGMFAYGGLRMGGEAFYGMNITDKASPQMLFTITADGRNDLNNGRFARLGQIWSKPTAAKIRWARNQEPRDVLIFGGGYDMNYESDTYVPTADAPAKGNAIYMIDAKTGRLLWSTSGENGVARNTKTDEMIHSITGEITVLDRDNDGLMDHLYAADLGGQVFRADFENARPAASGFTQVNNFSGKSVVRILDASADVASEFAYRFYERPIVSFYRNEGTGVNNGQIFALINVISGNRSAPLSKLRDDNAYANRVYGIIDSDVTNGDLYNAGVYNDNFDFSIEDLTEEQEEGGLINLAEELGNTPSESQKNTAKAGMIAGTVNGWYYPLTRFDGQNNVKYNKGMGDNAVINSLLYTTVYNPDKQYGSVNSCTAKIAGGSERQLYCLPYGICMEDTSITGTGGFIPAGQGIQELALGAYNANNTDLKVLIGTTPLAERIKTDNRVGFNNGGDGSASEYIFNERYTIQPRVWYERAQ